MRSALATDSRLKRACGRGLSGAVVAIREAITPQLLLSTGPVAQRSHGSESGLEIPDQFKSHWVLMERQLS